MFGREAQKAFRDTVWRGPQDAEAFLVAAPDLGSEPEDALKLLDMMGAKPLSTDLGQLRLRCTVLARVVERNPDKSLFGPFARALKSTDGSVRETLAKVLPAVNNITDHAEICGFLRSNDPKLRAVTAEVLQKIGGKTVFALLTEMVQDPGCAGRIDAMDALVPVAGHHAVGALQAVLLSGKTPEKVHALKYLADVRYMAKGGQQALQVLAGALQDPVEAVQVQALISFGALASEDAYFEYAGNALDSPSVVITKAAIEGLKRFPSPRTITALQRKLQAGPNRIRLTVLGVLEAIGNDSVLPALVDALAHRQQAVRSAAAEVFARLSRAGSLDATRTIVWLLRSRDVNVRRMAADLARTVRDERGDLWLKLLGAIKDEDWWVRERVMDALIEMAGKALTKHLVGYLSDPSPSLRRFAVDTLSRLKDPEGIPALIHAAQNDTDWWVCERSIEAIAGFKDERAVPYLVSFLSRGADVHLACILALTAMKAKSAAPHLVPLLASKDVDVRTAALKYLETVEERRPDEVATLLQDSDAEVRRLAKRLLALWNIAPAQSDSEAAASPSRLDRYLVTMADGECDDFILESGARPHVKRFGKVVAMNNVPLTAEQVHALLAPLLSPEQMEELRQLKDLDFSYIVRDAGLRFRVNVFQQAGGISAVFRVIKAALPELDSLGLPQVVKALGDLPNGLVLVGGPTGSGKSTTLAALINYINGTYARHILTIEDPIEVVHRRKMGLVNQRELGTHARSFDRALRSTLREDPDVILVGELRDTDTIRFAVSAADTGHLVFGTVHTTSADTAVDRLINAFPSGEQQQMRTSLSNSLRAVICQYLLKRLPPAGQRPDANASTGRCLALEIMVNNDAISNMIRKGKCYQLPSLISTSRELGMQTMDQDLMRLFKSGLVSADDVYIKARNKKDFELLFGDSTAAGAAGAAPVMGARAPAGTNPEIAAPGTVRAPTAISPGVAAAGAVRMPSTTNPGVPVPGTVRTPSATNPGIGAQGAVRSPSPVTPGAASPATPQPPPWNEDAQKRGGR